MGAPGLDRLLGPLPDLPAPHTLDADRRAAWVLWSAALLLVLLDFQGGLELGDLCEAWADIDDRSLAGKMYWVAWGALAYLVAPLLIVLGVFRESPSRYGLRVHFTRQMVLIYLALLTIMAGVVYSASFSPAFVNKYPMVNDLEGDPARVLLWESARAARFVCLEFFFRGFLLFGLEARFGMHAIAVAALPYGIMHHNKPFAEALGAVLAGAVLGLMALRSRSIAGGALLHIAVATSMDMLALWRKGFFE
jgi:membrane protease YdiL (CAAX protease family)